MAPENIYAKLLGLPQPSATDRALGRLGLNAVTGLSRGVSNLAGRVNRAVQSAAGSPVLQQGFVSAFGKPSPQDVAFTKAVLGAFGVNAARSSSATQTPTGARNLRGFIGPTQDIYEQPGVGYFDRRSGRFLGRGSSGQQDTGGGGGGPAERAYRQEVSRTAQLAAQNPELNRYEEARLKAIAPGATPEAIQSAEDIGMQIWAQKYGKPGGLASKVKPGQAGYDVIQRTLYPQGAPLPPLSPAAQGMLDAVAPVNAQGIRPDITPMPGQLPAFGTASEAMYQDVTDGGRLVTPMSASAAPTPQAAAAQNLVDIYKGEITGDDEFAKRLRAMQQYMQ